MRYVSEATLGFINGQRAIVSKIEGDFIHFFKVSDGFVSSQEEIADINEVVLSEFKPRRLKYKIVFEPDGAEDTILGRLKSYLEDREITMKAFCQQLSYCQDSVQKQLRGEREVKARLVQDITDKTNGEFNIDDWKQILDKEREKS